MKSKFILIAFLFMVSVRLSNAQSSLAILLDWAAEIGYADTNVYKVPNVYDTLENFITASFTVDSITGADILIAVYDTNGMLKWSDTWSGSGNNRDQAVAVTADDSCNYYIAGFTYSAATNFDIVVLKYDSSGNLKFTYTLNGTANNYDIPASIKVFNNFLYVTGEISDTVSLLNYVTVQLDKGTGVFNWKQQYNYANLFDVAFAMDISPTGKVTVVGASQDSLTVWKYCTLIYDDAGVAIDTTRIGGSSSNSFDRPMAVKSDLLGNFYLTGAASDSGGTFNVRTAKIDTVGGLAWVVDYGVIGKNEEGNDLIVDDSGYVYVCGKKHSSGVGNNYLLVKYNNSGVEQWYKEFDADSSEDISVKMCFDSYGNIILTGAATRDGNKDILTLGFENTGALLWQVYFNGEYHGDDHGTDITSDNNGNIYVTGQSQINDSTWQQVTIRYKTDYFLVPQDTVPAPSSLLFYLNKGQIIDTEDSVRTEGMYYYTINQFPKLFFHEDSVSFVFTSIDRDTATADTLERITMNLEEGSLRDPYEGGVHDSDQVLNYFLGHCPDGITGIKGSEKLFYSDVYNHTDVIFSNNSSGMKFQIIVKKGGEPGVPQLHFTGHQSLQLVNNADLQVSGILGSFIYERPLVYQLDSAGNRISLGWLASYNIIDSANVVFVLGGSYDSNKPLVFECARFYSSASYPHIKNLEWSTYFGGVPGQDRFNDVRLDNDHNVYAIGESQSLDFPHDFGIQPINAGDFDAVVSKFDSACILKWSTYLGGSTGPQGIGRDFGNAIAPDNKGSVYLVGNTLSSDFPLKYEVGAFIDSTVDQGEIFISKLSTDGTQLIWSTYFGDTMGWSHDMDLDNHNNLFIVGAAQVALVPFPGAYNSSVGDAIIAAFDSTNNPFWVTHFGDDIRSVAVGKSGQIQNRVYVTGVTGDGNIPIVLPADSFCSGSSDMVIACFYDNYNLNWSTYWGGASGESGQGIAVDDSTELVYVEGNTSSSDFPCFVDSQLVNAYMDSTYHPNNFGVDGYDAVILRFNATGNIQYATLYGDTAASSADDVIANNHNIYISGLATGAALPAASPQPPYAYVSAYKDSNNVNFNYSWEGFIVGMNDSLELLWTTYYGSWASERINSLCFDKGKSKLYIVGEEDEYPLWNPLNSFPWVEYDSTGGSVDYFRDGGPNPISQEASCFIARFDTRAIPGVGIEEAAKEFFHLLAYPNPVSNQLNLGFELAEKQNATLLLYNSMGQLLLSKELGYRQGIIKYVIDVSLFPKGVYFVSVNAEKLRTTATVVIQ